MTQLSNLITTFETLWPLALAETWDAPGLVSGDTNADIKRVLLTVDVTKQVIDEAAENFDLVLAHHPFLLRGVTSISEATAKGAVLATAIRSNLAIYAAHTNADNVEHGVSDALAEAFGLVDVVPLVSNPKVLSQGSGRIGRLPQITTLGAFAKKIANVIPPTASGVRVAGDFNQKIVKVALCGGAGDSFVTNAIDSAADVYVTSDLRHHVVQDTREMALLRGGTPALIDISHWAAEWLWLDFAAKQLKTLHPDIDFVVCDLRTDAFDFIITQ